MNRFLIIKGMILIVLMGLILSCKSYDIGFQDVISVHNTDCGSYEVKSNNRTIGYIVKPFIIELDRKKEITEFEQKLKLKYKNKFQEDLRTYSFTKNRVGDTILMSLFLSYKQVENIPKWNCELQEVEIYPKNSVWIDYNCTQNRFKILGDAD